MKNILRSVTIEVLTLLLMYAAFILHLSWAYNLFIFMSLVGVIILSVSIFGLIYMDANFNETYENEKKKIDDMVEERGKISFKITVFLSQFIRIVILLFYVLNGLWFFVALSLLGFLMSWIIKLEVDSIKRQAEFRINETEEDREDRVLKKKIAAGFRELSKSSGGKK